MNAVKPAVVMSLAIIGIATGCIAPVSRSAFNDLPATLPSELVANPEKFDGKHVNVRGYVVITPEGRNLFDSKAASKAREGTCLGLAGPTQCSLSSISDMLETCLAYLERKIAGLRMYVSIGAENLV